MANKRVIRPLKIAALLMPFAIGGCATGIEAYQAETPVLELNRFFNGHLTAYGIVQDYKGKVIRRFEADILGQWQGERGVLDERFDFADGEVQHRCWQLERNGDEYRGRADDVVGEASGRTAGNALNWQYVLQVPVDGDPVELSLNDWLYLVDENNLINRATMSKFGLTVGEITLYIRKESEKPHRELDASCRLDL